MGVIVGVDPGAYGAIAIIWGDGSAEVVDMPTIEKKTKVGGKVKKRVRVDPVGLAHRMDTWLSPVSSVTYIELVGVRPRQGASSSFTFGIGYGMVQGAAAMVSGRVELVTPKKWKSALEIPADKNVARYMAMELFPALKDQLKLVKHDGRAEALLVAYYGRGVEQGQYPR